MGEGAHATPMDNPNPPIGETDGFTDPDGKPFPATSDYMRGRMPDGSRPDLHSSVLYDRHHKPIPGEESEKNPLAGDSREIKHKQRLDSIRVLGIALRLQEKSMLAAEAVLDGKAPPDGVKPEVILRLGMTASRAVEKTTAALGAEIDAAVEEATTVDERRMFLENRAVAVVLHTLLELDDAFRDLGFGAWMPFRFPDQWLLFCSVMQKVLAANGLIHAKDPDVYRRLLEETPDVESDGFKYQNPGKMPYNWALCWTNRGAASMAELKARLDEEVWNTAQPRGP